MPSGNLIAPAEWNGLRGLISNQTAHDTDPQSFVELIDLIGDQNGRIRKRPGLGVPIDAAAAAGEITNMHYFLRVDPATGVKSWTVLRAVGTTLQKWNGAAWAAVPIGGLGAFTGSAWRFCNWRNRCWIVNGADGLFFYDGTTAATDGREIYRAGIATPTASAGYSLTAVDAPYSTGTVSVTKGAKLVVGSAATTWNITGAWDDKYIDISGVRYQIDQVTVASPGQLLLTEEYRGETAALLSYTIYIGLMDWSEPPQYAYGYKNTATGHVSNVSPILQFTEKDVVGRTPRITGIPYSGSDFQNGYDKIQIYRTAKDGTVLVAILESAGGLINNANVVGTTTFTESANTYRDTALSKFPAPIISNERPLNNAGTTHSAFVAIAEWRNRLWALSARDAKLFYSAAPFELEYGRADESWPSNNFLPVDDGRGLLRVGDRQNSFLLVQTGAEERYVTGFDVRDFDVPELPGGRNVGGTAMHAVSAAGSLVQFYPDRRLIDYGAQDFPDGDIGRPIQNKLDAISATAFEKARLVWFSYANRNLLLLSVPNGIAGANDVTYVFDRDGRRWFEWSFGISAFAIVDDQTTKVKELWGARTSTAKVHKLAVNAVYTDDGVNIVPRMKSAWIRPFGYGKAALWKWFQAFVSNAALAWQITHYEDEATVGETFALTVPDFRFESANGKEMSYNPTTTQKKRGEVQQIEVLWPDVAGDLWMDKIRWVWGLDQDVEETV